MVPSPSCIESFPLTPVHRAIFPLVHTFVLANGFLEFVPALVSPTVLQSFLEERFAHGVSPHQLLLEVVLPEVKLVALGKNVLKGLERHLMVNQLFITNKCT